MPFGRSLLQRESLLRVSGEERSPEILISFHSSGSTSNQWRKLKNPWFPGRILFRRSCCGTGKKKRFFAQLAHSTGPTCISYLAEEASDRLEFLPSWDSMDQDLLSLYGQYRSTPKFKKVLMAHLSASGRKSSSVLKRGMNSTPPHVVKELNNENRWRMPNRIDRVM